MADFTSGLQWAETAVMYLHCTVLYCAVLCCIILILWKSYEVFTKRSCLKVFPKLVVGCKLAYSLCRWAARDSDEQVAGARREGGSFQCPPWNNFR